MFIFSSFRWVCRNFMYFNPSIRCEFIFSTFCLYRVVQRYWYIRCVALLYYGKARQIMCNLYNAAIFSGKDIATFAYYVWDFGYWSEVVENHFHTYNKHTPYFTFSLFYFLFFLPKDFLLMFSMSCVFVAWSNFPQLFFLRLCSDIKRIFAVCATHKKNLECVTGYL